MSSHAMLGADPAGLVGVTVGRTTVRRVLAVARPYRTKIVGFLGTIVAAAIVTLAPPLAFRAIIDRAIPDGNRTLLALLAGLAVGAALAEAALAVAERWWSARIGEGVIFDLRVALFDHVQHMPLDFFTRTQTGALISRLNNDVIGAQRALTGTLGQVVSNAIVLVTTLTAMFLLQWQLTLLSLALLPAFILPAKRVGRRLQAMTRTQMDLNASMNATMTERFGVSGALLVKLFGRHDDERARFAGQAGQVRDIGVRAALYGRTFFIALGLVGATGTAAIYWVGGSLVISGAVSVGTLVALAAYVTRIYQPLTSLTNARVDLMSTLVSFERVFEVLDAPNPLRDRPGAVDLVAPKGRIELDHVDFAYPASDAHTIASLEGASEPAPGGGTTIPVLHDVSVCIEAGTMVALVGPSGAGKSTVAALVPRLYDVSSGAVRIDGHDVRDLTRASLRRAIGVVNQDPHLFHETVAENLRYARPGAPEADLWAACEAARIAEVVAALPQGLDTIVGERGYRLSGGEKQRLAIARMLLKDPAVVILDEATSHLDTESEALVQQALATALAGRTSLVIAHRLSTITAADRILVLDSGRVVEQGTHPQLVAAGGLYADLYRTLVRDQPAALGA